MKKIFEMTVVITRYGEPDQLVKQCLDSLRKQEKTKLAVLFLDQKNSVELENYCKTISDDRICFFYIKIPAKSLAYARNYGLEKAETDYVAFCDADTILESNWASEIINTFRSEDAAIVGTKILPIWQSKVSWYQKSRVIQEFYSMIDISQSRMFVRKVIGASFAFNKNKFKVPYYFKYNLDRRDGTLLSGGDTEFCERIADIGGKVVYTPFTHANHVVSKERISLYWILKRSYYGGLSRALRGGKIKTFTIKKTFLDYAAIVLIIPTYAVGYLIGKMRYA